MERLDELIAEVRDSRRTMENQIKGIQDELKKNKEEVAESVAKKVKRSMPPEFKRKGNEKQFKFNEEVAEKIQEAATELQSVVVPAEAEAVNIPVRVLEKAKKAITEGMSSIQDRQKLIRIADRSDFGWDVVQEYQADELAADSDDEKKLSKAEKAAEQKSQKRKRGAASGKKTGFGLQAQSPRSEWWKTRAVGPPMAVSPFPQFPPVQWHGGRSFTPTSSIPRSGRVLGPCFACNEFGHLRANCPKTAMAPSASKYPHNNDSLCLSAELPGECSSERGEERIEGQYWEYSPAGEFLSVKGRLKDKVSYWENVLEASHFVCEVVAQGYKLPFVTMPEAKLFSNQKSAIDNGMFVSEAIADLRRDGSVRMVSEKPAVCSPLLVATSRSNKLRLVINLRYINRFLWKDKFKYEDIHTALAYFEKGWYINTFDLKSGYHHIDIHVDSQTYLGFQWDGVYYVFTVLPFGLSTACYVFTKCLRPLVKFWRSKGLRSVLYIDDGIIVSQNAQEAIRNVELIRGSLKDAGFVVNEEKSHWELSQSGTWLGFSIDLEKGEIAIPEEKTRQLISMLEAVQHKDSINPKALASIVGRIISMGLGLGPITRLRTRSLYALLNSRASWFEDLEISREAKEELLFWHSNLEHYNGQKIWYSPSAVRVVFSDASETGFGGYTIEHGCHIAHGQWTQQEMRQSSTWRELAAVIRVLKAFAKKLASSRVKWFTDNQNVVRIIQVGSRVNNLQVLAVELFSLALSHQIMVEPEWVPRTNNELADYVSKLKDYNDWMLDPKVFKWLDDSWGPHTVDRFASSCNTQMMRFNSRYWDAGSEAIDAFTVNWQGDINWICPPVYLIPRVIRHAQLCACEGTLIVPYWRSAVFWPLLCNASQDQFLGFVKGVVGFEPREDLVVPGLSGGSLPDNTALLAIRFDFSNCADLSSQREVYP